MIVELPPAGQGFEHIADFSLKAFESSFIYVD